MSERLNRSYDFNTKEDEQIYGYTHQYYRLFRLSSNNNNNDRSNYDDTMAYLTKQG